jgi:hypothetical protein
VLALRFEFPGSFILSVEQVTLRSMRHYTPAQREREKDRERKTEKGGGGSVFCVYLLLCVLALGSV